MIYSEAAGDELSVLIQVERVKSSVAKKSKSVSSARDTYRLAFPSQALPNLPELVHAEVAVDKVISLSFGEESLAVVPYPSSNFQYPICDPTGEPPSGWPPFISSMT